MSKRVLNVEYSGTKTEIDTTEAERLGEVQDAIKAKLANTLAQVDAPQLQLYDQQGQHISISTDGPYSAPFLINTLLKMVFLLSFAPLHLLPESLVGRTFLSQTRPFS